MALAMFACAGNPSEESPAGPKHEMSWEQFRAQVYQEPDTGIFIVNGDEAVETEQGLRGVYNRMLAEEVDAQRAEDGLGVSRQELTVNRYAGLDDLWSSTAALNITYCISASSFGSNYSAVVNAMSSAAAAWEGTGARVDFIYSSGYDSNCSTATTAVVFNVRQVSGQAYLARAFFPNNTRTAREVLIDSSSFGNIAPYTLAGVLRHELGHALGFRHEHIRPEALPAGSCVEDSSWRALTAYDSYSVMHYPQCNGTNTGDLNLTSLDISGVLQLYPSNPIDESNFFTRQVYLDVLGREPTSTERVNGANGLQACNGNSTCLSSARIDLAKAVFESQENRTQNPELDPSSPNYNSDYLTQCYLNFLQRQPDSDGFNWWLNVLNASGDYRNVIQGFITSSEYRARFGPQ